MSSTRDGDAELTVRPPKASDRAGWFRLREALWPDAPSAGHLRAITRAVRQGTFVAVKPDGGVAGFIETATRAHVSGCPSSPVGVIEGWYVSPEWRRQGVGAALLRAAEQWLRAQGCLEIASDALLSSAESLEIHAAVGYRETERIVRFRKRFEA